MSKCGKNKKVTHKVQPSVTDVFYNILMASVQTHDNMESICFI